MEDLDLVTVATYLFRHEAEIAKAHLVAEGIASVVQADDEGGLNPGFFAEYGVRLVVKSEQRSAAQAVLTETGEDDEGAGITIDPEHLEAFLAHAGFCAPQEACGLLAFDRPGHLRFVYCLTNADRSEHRFTIDPTEQFRALQHAERNGWEIAGSFHSHPHGSAQPSATDIEASGDPLWVHVILGLGEASAPEMRAFAIHEAATTELSVTVR